MARWWRRRSATGPTWTVGPARRRRDGPWHAVEVDLDGTTVSFEILDHQPSDRIEAFLTASIPSALGCGADLVVEGGVDPGWTTGVDRAASLMSTWWGHAPTSPVRARTRPAPPGPPGRGTALCFTGGVDSFWALLHGGHDPTHLLYVIGYDVDADDTARVEGQLDAVRTVADARGLVPLIVRTDLRRHPGLAAVSWERVHGAAIAAAGIAASTVVDRLVIPPSYPDGALIPWGSRPDLDPLWSLPGVLEVRHSATDLTRLGRVQAIAADPLAQRGLRVCWEHLEPSVNCGRCEKCLRTIAMVATTPHLAAFSTLPTGDDLPARIRALHPIAPHHLGKWRNLLDAELPTELADAVAQVAGQEPG